MLVPSLFLADQNTLKPQVVKLQGEFDFYGPSISTETHQSPDADGWNEAPVWNIPTSHKHKMRNSKSMESDRKVRRKGSKIQTHNLEFKDAKFKADDGTEFTLDDLYIPPPRDVESSILEARSIMQNHIDKQYDIMEENKRSLRRQIDQHRNDSESKHSATSSEEDSTEKKEGSDTDSSIDSEDEELPPLGHGDRVEAKFSSSKTEETGSISKVNHRKQTYNILFDNGKRRSNIPRSEITLIMSLSRPDHSHKRHGHRGNSSDSDSDDGVSIAKGDRVEAKLKGWTKYYKGKITRENRDGTYDILFDDGERKSKVDAKLIKSLEKKKTKRRQGVAVTQTVKMMMMTMIYRYQREIV